MNRLLSMLLIPLFVLGQALPHSHAGSDMIEPDDHGSRPHVHLSYGHSHEHGHHDVDVDGHEQLDDESSDGSPQSGVWADRFDHDTDAIYVGQSNSTLGRASVVSQLSFANVCTFVEVFTDRPDRQSLDCSNRMPDRFSGLPIYLLVASLRL